MSCFVCEVCGWSDGEHASGCGLLAFIAFVNEDPDVRRERRKQEDIAFLKSCGIDTAGNSKPDSKPSEKTRKSPAELRELLLAVLGNLRDARDAAKKAEIKEQSRLQSQPKENSDSEKRTYRRRL